MNTDRHARLDEYLRTADSEESAAAYEEDLFARALAGDAPELSFRRGLEVAFRSMEARGTTELWMTGKQVDEMRAKGTRVAFVEFDPAKGEVAAIPEGTEILVTRVPLDLSGVERLDIEIRSPDEVLLKAMPEVSFDPKDQAIYACCEIELARASIASGAIARAFSIENGRKRLLVETRVGAPT
jgi:hypothetical protein